MKIILRLDKELFAIIAHKVSWKEGSLYVWTRDFSYCVTGIQEDDGEALVRKVFSAGILDLSGYTTSVLSK